MLEKFRATTDYSIWSPEYFIIKYEFILAVVNMRVFRGYNGGLRSLESVHAVTSSPLHNGFW